MNSPDARTDNQVMGTSGRREHIIQLLRTHGSVQVNELSQQFHVSTVTIRNDLAFLEKQGIAVRAYGGALICEGFHRSVSRRWRIKVPATPLSNAILRRWPPSLSGRGCV